MTNSIYEELNEEISINQGDIFLNLPFVQIDDAKILTFNGEKGVEKDLSKHTYKDQINTKAITKLKVLPGIIISQNCDILRSEYLSFCAIRPLEEVDGTYKNDFAKKSDLDKKKIDYFTKKYKFQEKYFYLPIDKTKIFQTRMAVDFSTIFQVKTEVIKKLLKGRKLKLNKIASTQFRQKMSNYFLRFVYDPWYPLNKDEFEVYLDGLSGSEKTRTDPCDWQR